VRGIEITRALLESTPPLRPSADGGIGLLRLRQPMMRGEAVRALQQALARAGIEVETDGVFGPATEAAVRSFQRSRGLVIDGIVGPATRAALDL
jgi:peptidoglycan hydrolase-like protein with peptidoglycan-binding domain